MREKNVTLGEFKNGGYNLNVSWWEKLENGEQEHSSEEFYYSDLAGAYKKIDEIFGLADSGEVETNEETKE